MSEQQGELPRIDVHTHVGLDQAFYQAGWWPYAATAQNLAEHMAGGGIDQAVCFPFGTPSAFDADAFEHERSLALKAGRFPFDKENGRLVQEIDRLGLGERLLPFAMFDPAREVARQVEHLEADLIGRVYGLKTQSTILRSPITALLEAGRPLMELAERHNLPVLFHTAISAKDEWAQTRDCLKVAEAYPKVRFNLAHSMRFHRPSLERAAELGNVWVDCSAHLIHCHLASQDKAATAEPAERVEADYRRPAEVLERIHAMLGSRYLWGSDNPYMSWCDDGIAAVYSYAQETAVLKELPSAVYDDMLRHGPRAWLYGRRGDG